MENVLRDGRKIRFNMLFLFFCSPSLLRLQSSLTRHACKKEISIWPRIHHFRLPNLLQYFTELYLLAYISHSSIFFFSLTSNISQSKMLSLYFVIFSGWQLVPLYFSPFLPAPNVAYFFFHLFFFLPKLLSAFMIRSLAYIIPNESHFQSGVAITTPFSAQKPPFQLKISGGGGALRCVYRYASREMENLVTISHSMAPFPLLLDSCHQPPCIRRLGDSLTSTRFNIHLADGLRHGSRRLQYTTTFLVCADTGVFFSPLVSTST